MWKLNKNAEKVLYNPKSQKASDFASEKTKEQVSSSMGYKMKDLFSGIPLALSEEKHLCIPSHIDLMPLKVLKVTSWWLQTASAYNVGDF